MAARVAVVTGGNKGIGFAIVKILCQRNPSWTVYLTARDEGRGQNAVELLKKEGCNPSFQQLDLDSVESIEKAKMHFQNKYGGVDVLVNNAGIAYKGNSTAPFSEQAEVTVNTNFFGTLSACKAFIPILREGARVVIVSSMSSVSALKKCSAELRKCFTDDMTMNQLEDYMKKFIKETKEGTHEKNGWPNTAYGVSKIGCTCMARILQKDFSSDARKDMVVNACCPGYVDTDMTSHKGPKTIEEGADTPVYLATLPPNTDIKGQFLSDRKIGEWK